MGKKSITKFQHSYKYAVLVGLATGCYPLIFYYTQNYSLINSVKHFGFFVGLFILIPIVTFLLVHFLERMYWLRSASRFLFPFLNVATFLCFIQLCMYARLDVYITLGIVLFALCFALFLRKYFKKVIVLQYIIALVSLFWTIPILFNELKYSNEWTTLPDAIGTIEFKKRPNVYFIQPDGYVNFSELNGRLYQSDNNNFEKFLSKQGFINYDYFRTNYTSTLFSNSSIFSMRHHYYKMSTSDDEEPIDARKIIVTENPVLSIFKKNGYKTHLVTERPYFLTSQPELGYDAVNFNIDDLSLISTGLDEKADIFAALDTYLKIEAENEKFFFIQIFDPAHITNSNLDSKGVEGEREQYLENLKSSNKKLKRIVQTILEHDNNALIVIMADHGGYVGFEHTRQSHTLTTDRDLIYSIFSSILSIKWPQNEEPEIAEKIKSPVNLFRILFSYLGEDTSYLDTLEEDASYIHLREGEEKGIFQYIDTNGEINIRKRY